MSTKEITIQLTPFTRTVLFTKSIATHKPVGEVAASALDARADEEARRIEGKPIQINWTGYIFAFFVGAVVGAIAAYLNLLWG